MSDQIPAAPADPPANAQLITALTIVAAITVIAVGLIVAGVLTRQWTVFSGGVFTAIGALATALNAPTGVANALAAANRKDPAQ
jgi:predicted Co/Zn/Cd cation transporter (cation efflux family)